MLYINLCHNSSTITHYSFPLSAPQTKASLINLLHSLSSSSSQTLMNNTMLPLSLVATIFTKLWASDRRKFFRMFLEWSAAEREENIETVLKELPAVDILVEVGWDRELMFLRQQLTQLGIEFHVHSVLFYAPCVAIFRNESVPENMEILTALAPDYPLARFAKNLFSIFYQTEDTSAAVEDLIQMTLMSHICREIDGMIKVMRRIQYCNEPWEKNCVFSYSRVPALCEEWVHDKAKHFKPCRWGPMPEVKCVQCRPCKAAIVLFQFCFNYYDDMYLW